MFRPQPSLSCMAEVDTTSLMLSDAQDRCEIGAGSPLLRCCGGSGSIRSAAQAADHSSPLATTVGLPPTTLTDLISGVQPGPGRSRPLIRPG
jgi:hypothetical protein